MAATREALQEQKPAEPSTALVPTSLNPIYRPGDLDASIAQHASAPTLMWFIKSVPNDILRVFLIPFLLANAKETHALAQVNRASYALFKPQLTTIRVRQLLQFIVYGNEKEAEKIIVATPQQLRKTLLLQRETVADYSFGKDPNNPRKLNGHAFQLASWGTQDVEMLLMLNKYLPIHQVDMQLPENDAAEQAEKNRQDLVALNTIVEAIAAIPDDQPEDNWPGEACETALDTFRDYLEPKGVITTGSHFNVNMLVEAFRLYDENFDRFDNGNDWDSPKNKLFWQKVIGYIQRFLPACYAQAFCQGIYYIVEGREKLNRSLEFRYDKGIFFFPLDADPRFRLGYDYTAGTLATRGTSRGRWAGAWQGGALLQNLCQAKTSSLRELMQRPNKQTPSRCLVM
jgi:hypothetical protein